MIDIGKRVTGYWVVEGERVYSTSEGKDFSMWSLGAYQPLHFIEIGLSVGAINYTDWLLLHLMKSSFWISLEAGEMIYGYLMLFPERFNYHLVVLTHIKKVCISAAPSGPMIRVGISIT